MSDAVIIELMANLNLKEYEEKLIKSKREIEEALKSMKEVPELGSDVDAFDTETDEAEEYSNELGKKAALKERLSAIRDALDRIKEGTYGKCNKCGMDIESAILNIDPESRFCKHCK